MNARRDNRIISATKDPAMARVITGHRSGAVLDYDESATSSKRTISNILQNTDLPVITSAKTNSQEEPNKKIKANASETENEKTDDSIMFRITKRDVTIEFRV